MQDHSLNSVRVRDSPVSYAAVPAGIPWNAHPIRRSRFAQSMVSPFLRRNSEKVSRWGMFSGSSSRFSAMGKRPYVRTAATAAWMCSGGVVKRDMVQEDDAFSVPSHGIDIVPGCARRWLRWGRSWTRVASMPAAIRTSFFTAKSFMRRGPSSYRSGSSALRNPGAAFEFLSHKALRVAAFRIAPLTSGDRFLSQTITQTFRVRYDEFIHHVQIYVGWGSPGVLIRRPTHRSGRFRFSWLQ